MKPRVRVFASRADGWWFVCATGHHCLDWHRTWPDALAAANAHTRTHARTDIASFLALRDDHPALGHAAEPRPARTAVLNGDHL